MPAPWRQLSHCLSVPPAGRSTEGCGEQPTSPATVTWGGWWYPNGKGPAKAPLPAWSSPHRDVPARFTKPQHSQRLGAAGTLRLPTARKGFRRSLEGAGGGRVHPRPGPRRLGRGDAHLHVCAEAQASLFPEGVWFGQLLLFNIIKCFSEKNANIFWL